MKYTIQQMQGYLARVQDLTQLQHIYLVGGAVRDAYMGRDVSDLDILVRDSRIRTEGDAFAVLEALSVILSERGIRSEIYQAYGDAHDDDFSNKWWACMHVPNIPGVPLGVDILLAREGLRDTLRNFDYNINACSLGRWAGIIWHAGAPARGFRELVGTSNLDRARRMFDIYLDWRRHVPSN